MPRVLLWRRTCVDYDAGMRPVMPRRDTTRNERLSRVAPGAGTRQQEARIKLINRDERKYGIGLTGKRPGSLSRRWRSIVSTEAWACSQKYDTSQEIHLDLIVYCSN